MFIKINFQSEKSYLEKYFPETKKISLDQFDIFIRKFNLTYESKIEVLKIIFDNYMRINENEFLLLKDIEINYSDVNAIISEFEIVLEQNLNEGKPKM